MNSISFKIISRNILLLLLVTSCKNVGKTTQDTDKGILQPIPFNEVALEDDFWAPRLITQKEELVPFALDKTKNAIYALDQAGKFLKGKEDSIPPPHRYQSSDLYKVMEGVSYLLHDKDQSNKALEKRMDSIIDIIESAQKDDGYLYVSHITGSSKDHSAWGGGGMGDKPYSWVLHSHELYNMGHMYEAAIAYYQATGKRKWLDVAEKNAKHINKVFFEGDPNYNNGKPINQAPGHQELELALVKLYRVTNNDLYLGMAKKFLEIRGRTFIPEGEGVMSPMYSQQYKPVEEQREAVGHSVRAAYMYSAMADVQSFSETEEYNTALNSIWHNIVDTKMSITGGLGAIHGIEGFGPEYVLPNKDAYNETCAAVGNVFFNYRMFLNSGDAKYLDIAEASLYNNALAGVNLEGNKFFYVNPLEADGVTPFNHGVPGRSPWFDTACCPSNIARLIPQVSGMMYAQSADQIYATLYANSVTSINLKSQNIGIKEKANYPFDGNIQFEFDLSKPLSFSFNLRIPTWARTKQFIPGELYDYSDSEVSGYTVYVNGKELEQDVENGFIKIDRKWKKGDEVKLSLPMPVRFNKAIEKVASDRNRLSITRGPLVYAAEEADNGDVQKYYLEKEPDSSQVSIKTIETGILKNIKTIELPVSKIGDSEKDTRLKLIPYYAWNNRGDGSMVVWLPNSEDLLQKDKSDISVENVRISGSLNNNISESLNTSLSTKKKINDEPLWISNAEGEQSMVIEFNKEVSVQSISVYWFVDENKLVKAPSQWSVEYMKNGEWKDFDLYVTDSYSVNKNQYNMIHPGSNMTCSAIRINIQPEPSSKVAVSDLYFEFIK